MSRGIQEIDVWQAADALLQEGLRPTIERVRQKIGRGSPNTVSPLLETWFKQLGGRIAGSREFSASGAGVPEPILQAARHCWAAAVNEARLDFEARLEAGLAEAVAGADAERQRAAAAEAAFRQAADQRQQLQTEINGLRSALEQDRAAAAAVQARLQDAQGRIAELQLALQQAAAETQAVREAARQDVALAQERAAAVERRATLAMDGERMARAKAEKRLETMDRQLQVVAQAAQEQKLSYAEQSAQARADLARLSADLTAALTRCDAMAETLVGVRAELADAERQAQTARSQSQLAERVISALKARTSRVAPAKRLSKRRGID